MFALKMESVIVELMEQENVNAMKDLMVMPVNFVNILGIVDFFGVF